MKILVTMLSGFCLTLAIFAGGALTAIYFVNAKPVPVHPLDMDTGSLWSNKPVKVNRTAQNLERLPARTVTRQPDEALQKPQAGQFQPAGGSQQPIDSTTTAAISADPGSATDPAHAEWCSQHYQSYDPGDDSYNAYSGVRRKCVSPHSEEAGLPATKGDSGFITAANADEMPGAGASTEHVQSCFDRYRSYRPEDNTYQPYGGGPRRQCE